MKNDQEIFKLAMLLMIEIPLFSCKLAMFDQKKKKKKKKKIIYFIFYFIVMHYTSFGSAIKRN